MPGVDSNSIDLASSDHTARLWEMASGETVRQYNGHHKGTAPSVPGPGFPNPSRLNEHLFFAAAVCCALHDGAS